MGGSSNDNSFIPRRGPANRPRKTASQQLYVFTLIAYVLFFATLVASAGVFFYGRYINAQLEGEVTTLNTEIDRFNEADMTKVRNFNKRLESVQTRIASTASLTTLLEVIENATARSARLQSLALERNEDTSYTAELAVETNTFDSSIFQREFYEQDNIIDSVEISKLDVQTSSGEDSTGATTIAFTATLDVPISAIPLIPPATGDTTLIQAVPSTEPVEEVVSEIEEPETVGTTTANQTDL